MRFHDPLVLALLPLLVPLGLILRRNLAHSFAHPVADGSLLPLLPETFRSRAARQLTYLRLPLLALLVIAMARPQAVSRETTVQTKAVDLAIALDLSTSMLAEDAPQGGERKSRATAAKEVLGDFLSRRSGDRIGLIVFAARPYPAAPLTRDHAWLQSAVERLRAGNVEDGTAIGDGLLAALNRLRNSPARSRAVILITDGRNNGGTPPDRAAAAAAALGIRVHTIGIGSRGTALFPVQDPLGGIIYRQVQADLDEAALRVIAATTGGSYFKADDQKGLARVFKEIDRLEKRPVEEKIYFSTRELFPFCLLGALALMLIDQMLRCTLLRRVP